MITVIINGESKELDGPLQLVDYLNNNGLMKKRIAVAKNGTVIRRNDYGNIMIESGDRIEIVLPVGGG